MLEERFPNWRELSIHESSPSEQGISLKLRQEGRKYVATHFRPGQSLGSIVDQFRNEDLQRLTFPDGQHDLFISLDVFEHIPFPEQALLEVYRTLKPGGTMLSTFPIRKWLANPLTRRVDYDARGNEILLVEPEYHGNPINPKGSIVTVDYGYDVHQLFATIVPFSVRIYRFSDRHHGIVGENTDVVMCTKPSHC